MPIVIWGSRGITSNLREGRFFCPHCNNDANYTLKEVRPYFTLYYIPLFPTGSGQRYVECSHCGSVFAEEVLEMEAPTEGQRQFQQIFHDLHLGASLDDAEKELVAMGMEPIQARNLLEELSEGKFWICNGCSQRYLNEVKRCRTCRSG